MYRSFFQTASKIVKEEGVFVLRSNTGLWTPGLAPSLLREFSYSSFRFGLYTPLKSALGVNDDNLLGKIASGASSGSIGSVLAVPTDRLKIRMQCEAGAVNPEGVYTTGLRKGAKQAYPTLNLPRAFKIMYDTEGGLSGLWKGWQPTVARAGLLAGAQVRRRR